MNIARILSATVTLFILMALVAGAAPAFAQGAAPDTPDRPTGTAVFIGGVDLEWNDVPGADSYGVQMYRNSQWTDLPADGIEIAFYGAGAIISELEPEGSSYWFRVGAINAHGYSEWSDFNFMAPTSQSRWGRQVRPDNVPASGQPVISGTAQVGESLTADTTGLEDGNGLDRVQFRFQWVSHDGSADTDIAGATDSGYTLVSADAGNTIKVRVAFTDRGGYAESLTGGETATVAARPNSPATGQPTITGTAQVGEMLTADTSGITDADGLTNATYSYQWLGDDTDIAGATSSTYTLAETDEGRTIKVRVVVTDDEGNETTLTSEATDAVEAAAQPDRPATGQPSISGTAQVGEKLTVDTSGIGDADGLTNVTYGYQWISSDGTTDTDISGETDAAYTLVADDVGRTIKVRVTFTDDAENETTLTSTATDEVDFAVQQQGSSNTPATGEPTISGTAQVGEMLTADTSGITDADGLVNATYSYQWLGDDTDIAGATSSTYTLLAGDEGRTIRVRVIVTDDAGNETTLTSAATEAVEAAPQPDSPATGAPTISGTAQVGEMLTADTSGITDADGLVNATFSYQWVANDGAADTDISGATDAAYTVVADDAGKTIKVRVLVTDDAGNETTLTSEATDEVDGIAVVWLPDNEPGGATNLGDVTSFIEVHSVNGTVSGVDDKVDYYRFSLTGSRRVELRLTSFVSDANLFLEGNHSVLLGSSVSSGLQEDSISIDLAAGTYFVRVQYMEGPPSTSYTLTYRSSMALTPTDYDDDYPDNAATTGLVLVGSSATGSIDFQGDRDWFRASFTAGQSYRVDAMTGGSGHGSLSNADLGGIYRSSGARIALTSNEEGGRFGNARTYFTPVTTDDYYIEVMSSRHEGAWPGEYEDTGTYTVAVSVFTDVESDEFTNFTDTDGAINIGGTVTGTIDSISDHDWIAMELESGPGHYYEIQDTSYLPTVLHGIYDSSGLGLEATDLERRQTPWKLPFAVDEPGTYFVSIGINEGRFHFPVDDPSQVLGDYTLRLDRYTARQSPMLMTEPACATQRIETRFELDEIRVDLTAGTTYRVSLSPPFIGIYYNWGVYDPDDRLIQGSRFLTRPHSQSDPRHVVFTASASGKHRIFVSRGGGTSWYDLCVDDLATPEPPEYIDLAPDQSADATLSGLELEDAGGTGITLTPAFDPATYVYTASVAYNVDTVTLRATKNHAAASVAVLTESGSSTPDEATVDLTVGDNPIRTMVTSEDGTVSLIYMVTVTRSGPAAQQQAPNSPATGAPAISGTVQVGETLTVDTSGISDADGLDNVAYSYQWLSSRDTEILGATNDSYALVSDDEGKAIKVKVSFKDDADNDETLTSAATAAVEPEPQPNSPATGEPTISGTAQVGEMLTADTSGIADDDGLNNVTYSYQWLSDDAEIGGATGSTYTLLAGDEGKTIKVRVIVTDDEGNETTLTSAATDTVGFAVQQQGASNTPTTGEPTISGMAQVGEMLTADTSGIADADGLTNVTFSYQWLGDDTDIAGATSSTYTLLAGDEGQTIKVRVIVTDDLGNETTLTSTATAAVASPEPPAMPTGLSPSVSHDDVTLTWDDPQDDSITGYVILRRDRAIHLVGTFVTLTDDTGSADTTYTDATVEPDKEYVYRIQAINEHGEVSERSDWVRGFTPAVPVPDKPTGLSAAVSHDAVALTWDDPQDDSITGYVILRRDREIHLVGTFITITDDTGSADTTYTDETVEPDKEYVYRIKAINEHGEVSEESHWVRGFTPAAPAPAG